MYYRAGAGAGAGAAILTSWSRRGVKMGRLHSQQHWWGGGGGQQGWSPNLLNVGNSWHFFVASLDTESFLKIPDTVSSVNFCFNYALTRIVTRVTAQHWFNRDPRNDMNSRKVGKQAINSSLLWIESIKKILKHWERKIPSRNYLFLYDSQFVQIDRWVKNKNFAEQKWYIKTSKKSASSISYNKIKEAKTRMNLDVLRL